MLLKTGYLNFLHGYDRGELNVNLSEIDDNSEKE